MSEPDAVAATDLVWDSRTVPVEGGEVAAQDTGPIAGRSAVLLIGGATWSRDWWPEPFCAALVAAGLRVLRYDQRDTGAATLSPVGEPGYTAPMLADDAAAVLSAFDVGRACVLGLSMGGGTAQLLAATHPDRVASLVLVSTSPAGDVGRDLPGPTPEIVETFTDAAAEPDWSDHEAVVTWVVETERPYAGPGTFDESAVRALADRAVARTPSLAPAATNHLAVAGSASSVDVGALRGIPALVIHGGADPLFPPAHGRALAEALAAPLLVLAGVGHELPPASTWDVVVPRIAELALGSVRAGDTTG
ncbi:alpha/beta fold hydrolase [Serinibacter arcticus]|nr:alpha/beta hydrolase [Serinibacter arcticus]